MRGQTRRQRILWVAVVVVAVVAWMALFDRFWR